MNLQVILIHEAYRPAGRRSMLRRSMISPEMRGIFGLGMEAAHGSYGELFRVGCGDILNSRRLRSQGEVSV